MFEWTEEQQMIRDAVREFVEDEIRPHREELEHGDMPPYDMLRKLYSTFGMDQMAARRLREAHRRRERTPGSGDAEAAERRGAAAAAARRSCCCRSSSCAGARPGMVTAMGVAMGLTAAAIMSQGHDRAEGAVGARPAHARQDRRVGDHRARTPAPTRSARCSRPRGATATSTCSTARRRSSPTAPTPTRSSSSASSTRATRPPSARSCSFVLDKGMPGLEQSKPLRKMGMHSSPTGELFLDDVRVGQRPAARRDRGRVRRGGREGAKATFSMERTGVAAMALGIIEQCLELCVEYAKDRVQFGQPDRRVPAHPAEAGQDGGRAPQRRRTSCSARSRWPRPGKPMTLAEASAMKLYSAQARHGGRARGGAALRRQRLHGRVPGRAARRDAKVLQIYAGTDEIQISQIARSLLA